jgi:hypothetical protein
MKRPTLKWLAVAICSLSLALTSSSQGRAPSPREQGQSLFTGRQPLVAKIRGHQHGMPPEVVVCANCHTRRSSDAGPPAAPIIDRNSLREQRQRRGGPPSAYDVSSFCTLLRTGVDPAHVLVDRVMPVYDSSDAVCSSLWEYLAQ